MVRRLGPVIISCLLLGLALSLVSQPRRSEQKPGQLKIVEVKQPDAEILSFRYLAGSTEVFMHGMPNSPETHIKMKIGSRPGFVELDINRGQITGLKPANQFGRDFLTYVLWAVSVDGKASNLGEITFENEKPISINVTTPYQTFWLMLTAEPSYAVVDPSPVVVAYSASEGAAKAPPERIALAIRGSMFYYTHYANYDSKPIKFDNTPNALLQARKAVELASKTNILDPERAGGPDLWEEKHTREALKQAHSFLARAEEAYKQNPNGADVAQFSRTSAQIAENARALAQGAVGGVIVSELENEVKQLEEEVARLDPKPKSGAAATPNSPDEPETTSGNKAINAVMGAMTKPLTWFCAAGWIVALLLLFRRRTI